MMPQLYTLYSLLYTVIKACKGRKKWGERLKTVRKQPALLTPVDIPDAPRARAHIIFAITNLTDCNGFNDIER